MSVFTSVAKKIKVLKVFVCVSWECNKHRKNERERERDATHHTVNYSCDVVGAHKRCKNASDNNDFIENKH